MPDGIARNITSLMNINFGWDWVFLILLLLTLIYTMRVIKNEKNKAIKNGVPYPLGDLILTCPPWWTLTSTDERALTFERTDTRYDWKGSFTLLDESAANLDLHQKFISIIQDKKLFLDEIHVFAPHEYEHQSHRILHIESTGTMNAIERVYYDAYLVYQPSDYKLYYFESLSSVLNGMVEGPYFEEASKNFKWTKS